MYRFNEVDFRSLVVLLLLFPASAARGENWPQWRGPFFNGSTTETDLPATWSMTENMKWMMPMPGPGDATPIIWEDRVFVSSVDRNTRELLALCIAADSGDELWRRKVGDGSRAPRNTMASPSPVTDGKAVWFLYGTGDLVAFDFDGKTLWSRKFTGEDDNLAIHYGYSSSPLLYDGRIYIQVLQRPKDRNGRPKTSYLLAVDSRTGKDVWKHTRSTDASGGAAEGYSTPIPHEVENRSEILVFGASYVTAHAPDTGAELWRWGSYNPQRKSRWVAIPSPLTGGGLIFVGAPKHSTMYALKAGGKGRLGDEYIAWKRDELTPDVTSPLLYRGKLYTMEDDKRIIVCLDPQTGRELWQGKLGCRATIRSSLTGADGKLYGMSKSGEAFVLKAGGEFDMLHRMRMDKRPSRSTIAISGGRLFIRTATTLYCVSKTD